MHQFVTAPAPGFSARLLGDPREAPALGQFWVAHRDEHHVEPAALHHPQVRALFETQFDDAVWTSLDALWRQGARLLVVRDRADQVLACGAVSLDSGEIAGVMVSAQHRRLGLGERLIKSLERDARRARCSRLWLRAGAGQHAALRLFERLNYEPCGDVKPGRGTLLMAKSH